MKRVRLSKNSKRILLSLKENHYHPSVPDNDVNDFLILREMEFVSCVVASDKDSTSYLAPRLEPKGLAYIVENPKLKNPSIFYDWKFWITTIIALLGVIIALTK